MAATVATLTFLTFYSLFLFIGFALEWEDPSDVWPGLIIGGIAGSLVPVFIVAVIIGGCHY